MRGESKSKLLERMKSKNSLVVPSMTSQAQQALSPNTESLKTFAISPSYQSDLTDCSFYPPTLANPRRFWTEEREVSLDMITTSYTQLCPCAMEVQGACPSCARGLSFPLSPVNPSQEVAASHGLWDRLKRITAFHVYFSIGNYDRPHIR